MKVLMLTACFVVCSFLQKSFSQSNLIVTVTTNPVNAKKIQGLDLLLPTEISFTNLTGVKVDKKKISVTINNTKERINSQIDNNDINVNKTIKLINEQQEISVDVEKTEKLAKTIYLFIDKSVSFPNDKIFWLDIKDGANVLASIKITIQLDDKTLSLDEYMESGTDRANRLQRLDYVTKVESTDNILTVSGYRNLKPDDNSSNVFMKKKVELQQGEVLSVNEWSYLGTWKHWKPWPVSIITVPFKIRPGITSNGNYFKSNASAGISNVGFNLDLVKYQKDRYFATGKKSSHKFSLGFLVTPGVEDLDSVYTNGALGKAPGKLEKSKQLFISAGFTISYSYNDISFVIVPYARDFGTSTTGKQWIYHDERWWGFGIAISPKIFSTILNK